jgi:hypothetical protein
MLDEYEAALKEQTKRTKKEVGAQEIEMAIDEA